MPGKRNAPDPIGLGLVGSWTQLEPLSAENVHEFDEINAGRMQSPVMGAIGESGSSSFAPTMLARDRRSGRSVGILENHEQPGGAAVFVAYIDPERGRVGYAFEAISMYLSCMFDGGARRVITEVLEFNKVMLGIQRKVDVLPQARLREHVYTAGRYWDLIISSFDRAHWVRVVKRYRRMLPGGDRGPVAFGGVQADRASPTTSTKTRSRRTRPQPRPRRR